MYCDFHSIWSIEMILSLLESYQSQNNQNTAWAYTDIGSKPPDLLKHLSIIGYGHMQTAKYFEKLLGS